MTIAATWRNLDASSRGRFSITRLGAASVLACLAGLAWWNFAPTKVAGSASYVVTSGQSMLPTFHANGLVVTRAESRYRVGQVVAYHNRQLHEVVMHRIVGRVGDRYVFKGDNNDYLDQYHPRRADLIGKEWIYWPTGGRYLRFLRAPLTFGLLLGVIGLIAATGFAPQQSRRRRRRRHAD